MLRIVRTTLNTSTLAIRYNTARNTAYDFFVVFVVGFFAPGLL